MEKGKISSYFIILILVLVCLVSRLEAQTLQKVVSSYVAKYISENSEIREVKRSRKIVTGDLDKDGDKDAAVFIVIELTDNNSWEYHLAVFENRKGKYKFVVDEQVGGRFIGNYTLTRIENGKILGTMECQDNQSRCDGKTKTRWNENFKLVSRRLQIVE